ncbi:MAG: hypothetical protein AAB797_02880 [Patescibacteria group bacterium]
MTKRHNLGNRGFATYFLRSLGKEKKVFFPLIRLGNKGVTLIETLVAVGLFILIALALFGVYEVFGKLYNLGGANFTAVGGSRSALTQLSNFTSQANRVLQNRTINSINYISGTTTLVLKLPAIDIAGKTIDNIWDYAVFYVSSTNLYSYLEKNAGSFRVGGGLKLLSNTIVSTNFSYDNADFTQVKKVTAAVTTTAVENRVSVISQASEQIFLKNY